MIFYTLYEGQNSNDNDNCEDFKSKEAALKAFKLSTYPYAVVHVYEGRAGDADYIGTLAEKGVTL